MLSILSYYLVMATDRVLSGDAQVQVVVFTSFQRGVEHSHCFEHRPPKHHRHDPAHTIVAEEIHIRVRSEKKGIRAWHRPAIAGNHVDVPRDKGTLRMSLELAKSHLDRLWQQPIVGIEEDQVVAGTVAQPGVARRRQALVLLPHVAHPRVAGSDLPRVVRRARAWRRRRSPGGDSSAPARSRW